MLKRLLLMICLWGVGVAWAEDRLELDATAIQGNRELPKVLYIVPWKSSKLGALAGGADEGSFGAEWRPVDRHVFRRHVEYFDMALGENEGR
jgi:hypothetical protein